MFAVSLSLAHPREQPQEKIAAALRRIVFDRFDNVYRRKLLNISDDTIEAVLSLPSDDHVDMAAHDAACTHVKSLVPLTIPDAIQEYVAIVLTGEYIKPMHDGERDKVRLTLVTELVTYERDIFKFGITPLVQNGRKHPHFEPVTTFCTANVLYFSAKKICTRH